MRFSETQALDLVAGLYDAIGDAERLASLLQQIAHSTAPEADEDGDLRERLMPHMQRALRLHEGWSGLLNDRKALLEGFDRLRRGVILADGEGRVLLANQSARAVLGACDGIELDAQRRLRVASPRLARALRDLLVHATQPGAGAGVWAGDTLCIHRPSGRRPLVLRVTPGGDTPVLGLRTAAQCSAIVFIVDPEGRSELPEAALCHLYDLTHAEARLAARLLRGESLDEATRGLGVSSNTVRTHLKRIFDKTGTHRQTELIRLLLGSCG